MFITRASQFPEEVFDDYQEWIRKNMVQLDPSRWNLINEIAQALVNLHVVGVTYGLAAGLDKPENADFKPTPAPKPKSTLGVLFGRA